MKFIISIILLVFGPALSAQVEKYVGNYDIRHEAKNAIVESKLSLNRDGRFLFQSYSKHNLAVTTVTDMYGKGKWSAKNNVIFFWADEENDIDQEYALNFNNTKARYRTRASGRLSDKGLKTSLIFYDSDIFWLEGTELYKKED